MTSSLVRKFQNRWHREEIYSRVHHWDAKAENLQGYAISLWENNALNELYHAEQIQILSKLLPNVKGAEVLDAGCGVGRISRWLADRGAQVTGTDFSEKTINVARSLSGSGNPSYIVQSVFDLRATAAYDIVISTGLIAVACRTRDDLSRVLILLKRALKPGGSVVFIEPIHSGFLHRVLNLSLKQFREMLTDAGFSVGEITHQLHFWPARWLLAFFPLPSAVTKLGYRMGQFLMRFPGFSSMGDYRCIHSRRPMGAAQ